jgi:hypothetical protein
MTDTLVRLAEAYHFAAVKHVGQRRKGEIAEPMNHLAEDGRRRWPKALAA